MDSVRDTACAVGCPIRRSADQRALASSRSFSQRATSFIASQCQGIHQMPLPQRLIAKTRRSQEQTPATRTGPRVKTLILQGNPQRWAPSAFTETRPRKTRANASAHSLFTCQRSNRQAYARRQTFSFPDRSLRSRGASAAAALRSRGASAAAALDILLRKSQWWR